MSERIWNAPNIISMSRLVLSFVLFALLSYTQWWTTCAILFVIAIVTDAIDGYIARKYNLVTTFGRILDPLVDKVIVCGSFIFLQNIEGSGVTAWVSLVIVIREMYITSLRGFLEQQGIDFSAKLIGKLKLILQAVAIPVCMLSLEEVFAQNDSFIIMRNTLVIGTVLITIYSGIDYTKRGVKLFREHRDNESASNKAESED